MNMKKIELLGTRHFRHFHCERQSVVGARKQSVVRKFDSMEMKALLRQVEPNGLSVTKKENLWPPRASSGPRAVARIPLPPMNRKHSITILSCHDSILPPSKSF